jgi:hypothetical protein
VSRWAQRARHSDALGTARVPFVRGARGAARSPSDNLRAARRRVRAAATQARQAAPEQDGGGDRVAGAVAGEQGDVQGRGRRER